MWGWGFGCEGVGGRGEWFGVWDSGFGVYGRGFRGWVQGSRDEGLGFRDLDLNAGCRVFTESPWSTLSI